MIEIKLLRFASRFILDGEPALLALRTGCGRKRLVFGFLDHTNEAYPSADLESLSYPQAQAFPCTFRHLSVMTET